MSLLLTAPHVLVDPRREGIDDGGVVVDGELITFVGPRREAEHAAGPDAERVEIPGTLLPGLVDAHVHLGFDGSDAPVAHMQARDDAELLLRMASAAGELLDAGVTTARELGARNFLDVDVKKAIAAGYVAGPRLLVATRPITTTGGHCWFMGGEADGVDEVRKAARVHMRAGADVIKVMATGGFMTGGSAPWHPQFSVDEIAAAVAEAHRLGRTVAAHAHGTPGIRNAVHAGVDTIEHCTWVTPDGAAIDEEVLAEMVRRRVSVCPTMNCRWDALAEPDAPPFAAGLLDRIARMREAGVRIIAGTDAGIDGVPHGRYLDGLDGLAASGMNPNEVLTAATVDAAAALGVSQLTGTLQPGKAADVIGVLGDPTTDLGTLRFMPLVVAAGRVRRRPA